MSIRAIHLEVSQSLDTDSFINAMRRFIACWPLARIVDVQRNDKDGFVRRVTVKTKTSTLQRPIDKIILLEST